MSQPYYVPNPKVLPSTDERQDIKIRPGSALAVLGVFVETVRKRFVPVNTPPWKWDPDAKKAEIVIESAFNEDQQTRNFKPAIFIDRDELTTGRPVLGDFAGQNLHTGLRGFWGIQTMPILIECVAAKKLESMIIGDLTHIFLHASSDLIQAAFGFHDMTPLTLGRTQPYARDKTAWVTSITFTVQWDLRWTNAPSAPLVQQIQTEVKASGLSATDYFERIIIESVDPTP